MKFDLIDLRLFLNVIEAQSLTRGAQRSHLALASASVRIKAMEDSLGTPLLERQRRGVRPTAAGRALAHHAQALMQRVELMAGELGQYAAGLRARVRLLSNTAALAEHLPDLLGDFLLAHPHIDLDIAERPSHLIVEALARRQAELGILADSAGLDGLQSRPFRSDRLVLIAAKARSEFRGLTSVHFEELLTQPFVTLAEDNPLQQHIEGKALKLGAALPVRIRVASFDTVCKLVARDVGIAVIPEAAVKRFTQRRQLQALRIDDPWSVRALHLCTLRFADLSPQARLLADSLCVATH